MAASVNKVILVGNLGTDPEIKNLQSGDKVANFSIATSESWKDKATGERKERTEWHRIVIFNQPLVKIVEQYLKKGSKVYLEGQLETRSWEQNGEKKYTTEVVMRPFNGEIVMLDTRESGNRPPPAGENEYQSGYVPSGQRKPTDEFEDEIPF